MFRDSLMEHVHILNSWLGPCLTIPLALNCPTCTKITPHKHSLSKKGLGTRLTCSYNMHSALIMCSHVGYIKSYNVMQERAIFTGKYHITANRIPTRTSDHRRIKIPPLICISNILLWSSIYERNEEDSISGLMSKNYW